MKGGDSSPPEVNEQLCVRLLIHRIKQQHLLLFVSPSVYLEGKSASDACEVNTPFVFYGSSKDSQEESAKLLMLVSCCLDSCSAVYYCTLHAAI